MYILAHVGLLAYRPNLCICNPNPEQSDLLSHSSLTWNQSRDPLFLRWPPSARRGGDSPSRRRSSSSAGPRPCGRRSPSLPPPARLCCRPPPVAAPPRRHPSLPYPASRRRSGRSPSSSRRQSGRRSPASRRWLGRCPTAPGRRVHSPSSVLLPWGPLRLLLLSAAFPLGLPVWM